MQDSTMCWLGVETHDDIAANYQTHELSEIRGSQNRRFYRATKDSINII